MSGSLTPSVLLVDDVAEHLEGLADALAAPLRGHGISIRKWRPTESDGNPQQKFESLVDAETLLVVTDYDLTGGVRGLFGLTIVGWCQKAMIPVGDFSRGNINNLPKEPNLFEFRVPPNNAEAATFITTTATGFKELRAALNNDGALQEKRSLASVLAAILRRPEIEVQFAQYMSRLGASNTALIQRLREFEGAAEPSAIDKMALLNYVLGHVLFNSILKYPGPILSDHALCALLATEYSEADALSGVFAGAKYTGPFSQSKHFFWRDQVEAIADGIAVKLDEDKFDTSAELYRAALEAHLGRALAKHKCDRCSGTLGGFICPFTARVVCIRPDCSVSASSWIPQGAQLCRVEKSFYDEWAPLLGL